MRVAIDDAVPARFLAHLLARRRDQAVGLAMELLDRGVGVDQLADEVIGPAQAEVGARWQRDELSVADEHAATAICDQILTLATGRDPEPDSAASVALVCPEGEWHLLPARLAEVAMRGGGTRTVFLGPSLPADHLRRFLESERVDAVALSCTTALALPGARRCIDAAHDAGCPVVVGGRAWGHDATRADALGADAWAPDPGSAMAALARARRRDTPASPPADVTIVQRCDAQRPQLVDRAMARLSDQLAAVRDYDDRQLARTREDLAYLLQFAAISVLAGDPRLFDELVAWLTEVLAARGVPAAALAVGLAVLGEVTAADLPEVATLLEEASSRLG